MAMASQSRQTHVVEPPSGGNRKLSDNKPKRPDAASTQTPPEWRFPGLDNEAPEQPQHAHKPQVTPLNPGASEVTPKVGGPQHLSTGGTRTQSLWVDSAGVVRTPVPRVVKPKATAVVESNYGVGAGSSGDAAPVEEESDEVPPAVPMPAEDN